MSELSELTPCTIYKLVSKNIQGRVGVQLIHELMFQACRCKGNERAQQAYSLHPTLISVNCF